MRHLETLKSASVQPAIDEDDGTPSCSSLCPSYSEPGKLTMQCMEDRRFDHLCPSVWDDCMPFVRIMAKALQPKEAEPATTCGACGVMLTPSAMVWADGIRGECARKLSGEEPR